MGSHYPQLPNTCGSGSPILDVAIHYPAQHAGLDAPLLPRTGGWPVVVFLHGFNLLGLDYFAFGANLASRGFAVVMLNTGRTDFVVLDQDARSLPDALTVLNASPGVLSGGLDLQRMGLMGHSMGGGVTGLALARSDYYRCGFALAPVFPGPATAGAIEVPFGILVGAGDAATPWVSQSSPYYHSLGTTLGLRMLYVMDGAADHLNLAGLWLSGPSPIFDRALAITAGWFQHYLDGRPTGLDACLGNGADKDLHRIKLERQVFVPQTWVQNEARIGATVRLSVACEDGLGGVLGAASLVSGGLPTIFGTLYLDPSSTFPIGLGSASDTRRIDITLSVPNNVNLIGVQMPVQGLGAATNDPVRLGSPVTLTVRP